MQRGCQHFDSVGMSQVDQAAGLGLQVRGKRFLLLHLRTFYYIMIMMMMMMMMMMMIADR